MSTAILKRAEPKVLMEEDSSSEDENSNKMEVDDNSEDENINESSGNENNEQRSENENSDADDESDSSVEKSVNDKWAESMAKILQTNKPKGKKTIVLAKAKKLNDVVIKEKVNIGFEVEGEIKEEKPSIDALENTLSKKLIDPSIKKKKVGTIRVKPSVLDRPRERTLSKIATRGVVQLFNAVRTQQRDLENKLEEAGPLERKREKVLKNIDKRAFLDVLMGGPKAKSQLVDKAVKTESKKEKIKTESDKNTTNSTWSVLRDDFMVGGKLKDWDKNDDNESDASEMESIHTSDSE